MNMAYWGLSLSTSSLGGNNYIVFAISGAVEIVAYFVGQILLDRVGRRWLMVTCNIAGGAVLLCILAVPSGN